MFFKRPTIYFELVRYKEDICKYWREHDDSNGLFEYCKLIKKPCYCCGTLKQCSYKWKRFPVRSFIFNFLKRRLKNG